MNDLKNYAIPVHNDAEVLAYYRKTEKDLHFIENQSLSYLSDNINECIEFLHETYEMDIQQMITSIKTKKPVNDELTLLFLYNHEYLIFSAEVTV